MKDLAQIPVSSLKGVGRVKAHVLREEICVYVRHAADPVHHRHRHGPGLRLPEHAAGIGRVGLTGRSQTGAWLGVGLPKDGIPGIRRVHQLSQDAHDLRARAAQRISPSIVAASMNVASLILTAAGLSFIGLGVQALTPE